MKLKFPVEGLTFGFSLKLKQTRVSVYPEFHRLYHDWIEMWIEEETMGGQTLQTPRLFV